MDWTCWRGMTVDHPAVWEMSLASSLSEPGRCCFSDRTHQRLEVSWRPLKYVPNMDLMLDKFRRKTGKKLAISDLAGAPDPWRGVLRRADGGEVVHAGRFFRETRTLVEVTTVWPAGAQDVAVRDAILSSISPEDPATAIRTWRAMGVHLLAPRRFELQASASQVGEVRWRLGTGREKDPLLTVRRLAMPGYWLKGPLRDWLAEQLHEGAREIRQGLVEINRHRGEQLISVSNTSKLAALRRLRRLRVDVAWRCPIEERVYHVGYNEIGSGEEIALPAGVEVECCKGAPPVSVEGGP